MAFEGPIAFNRWPESPSWSAPYICFVFWNGVWALCFKCNFSSLKASLIFVACCALFNFYAYALTIHLFCLSHSTVHVHLLNNINWIPITRFSNRWCMIDSFNALCLSDYLGRCVLCNSTIIRTICTDFNFSDVAPKSNMSDVQYIYPVNWHNQ